MQSEHEDTLEERYALQTTFGPSCINQASIFEWHKRFKEGRESVSDDERCGRSKKVNTPQLIVLYSHLHHHSASQRHNIKDRRMKENAGINNAGRKTWEDFFRKIFTSHFIARVRKGCSRFACERVLATEHKLHILTPLLWPSRCVCLVLMLGSTPSGLSEGPLGWVWLPLPHLLSSCLEFYWQLLWHPTQLNYIIIQRLHDRPLELWNRMFNRHQAEITVMQFRGYSSGASL